MEKIKMPQPLVSIILPTYNVYPYLTQCLDSILAQTYKNIEVIIVIDGATDGSHELAKSYCKKDKRFSVYWQENAGSGPARNNGLSHAKGKFVAFIDPDDWVKEDYIERLVSAQREGDYDLVLTTSEDYYFSKNKALKYMRTENTKDDSVMDSEKVRSQYAYLLEHSMVCAPTKTLYKIDIIRKYRIAFPDMRRSQDIVFNYRYFDHVSSLRTLSYHGYCYRVEFSQWLNRLKPDYYKTIKFLFYETKALHEKWNVNRNVPLIASIYTGILSAAVESCVSMKQSISDILKDESLQDMVRMSVPKGIAQSFFKFLFLFKMSIPLKWMMRLKHCIKARKFE